MSSRTVLVRTLAVVLLLFAAADLTIAGACSDTEVQSSSGAQWCAGHDDAPASGHDGDDCFCCSRTVRDEAVASQVADLTAIPAAEGATGALLQTPPTPLYHPPLAT